MTSGMIHLGMRMDDDPEAYAAIFREVLEAARQAEERAKARAEAEEQGPETIQHTVSHPRKEGTE